MTEKQSLDKKSREIKKHGGARPGSGRPAGSLNKATADIRAAAAIHGASALGALADIALNEEAPPSARVAAAVALLDRGYGKPNQSISAPDGKSAAVVILSAEYAAL